MNKRCDLALYPFLLFAIIAACTACRADWREQLALGNQLLLAGRLDEAARIFDAELVAAQLSTPDSSRVGIILLHTAAVKIEHGEFLEATRLCEQSLAIMERTLGPDDHITLIVVDRLADLALQFGHFARAERLARRIVEANERGAVPDPLVTALALRELGFVNLFEHKPSAAEPLLRRALTLLEGTTGNEITLAKTLNSMAWVMLALRRYPEGIEFGERARHLTTTVSLKADVLTTLGMLYMVSGRQDDAMACVKQSVRDAERTYGLDHYQTALSLRAYAMVLRREKRGSEAKSAEKRAARILGAWPGGTNLANAIVDVSALLKGKK